MNVFFKNIGLIVAIRFEQLFRDLFDLSTLVSISIAGFTGYYFQSRYVYDMIESEAGARAISMLVCIGLTILVKNWLYRIDENEKLTRFFNMWVKSSLGLVGIIFGFWVDSQTSNSSIETKRVYDVANTVQAGIDQSAIAGLERQQDDLIAEREQWETREKATGYSYRGKKNEINRQLTQINLAIANQKEKAAESRGVADKLRVSTVQDVTGDSHKSYFGTFLLAIAIGLELVSSGRRVPMITPERAIDSIPYAVAPIQAYAPLPVKSEVNGPVNGFTVTEMRTTTHSHSVSVSWTVDADGWVSAMRDIAKEKQLGNGKGLPYKAAKLFGVNPKTVSDGIRQALAGNEIRIPAKLLKSVGEIGKVKSSKVISGIGKETVN